MTARIPPAEEVQNATDRITELVQSNMQAAENWRALLDWLDLPHDEPLFRVQFVLQYGRRNAVAADPSIEA